jgi:uncharacterized RDD family membrane protein YckC
MVADVFGPGERPSKERLRNDAWARFLGRSADVQIMVLPAIILFGFFAGVASVLGYPQVLMLLSAGGVWTTVTGIVLALVFSLLLESLCLSLFGSTPGKKLMGVRVRDGQGAKISFLTAAKRWFLVLVMGRGLDIPVIWLITAWTSFNHYEEHASTTWDDMLALHVARREVAWWRWALGVLIFVAGILFTAWSMMGKIIGV